ncbi:MAG: hypothetical protein ACREUR_09150 [Nitrosospira sp.]
MQQPEVAHLLFDDVASAKSVAQHFGFELHAWLPQPESKLPVKLQPSKRNA